MKSRSPQQALLRRVQARDPEGWRVLLELYGPVVHSWCRRWGLQDQDSDDVAQEVFCAVLRRVDQFCLEKENGLRAWLWTITHNKLRDHHRRQVRAPRTGGKVLELLLKVAQPEGPSQDLSVTRGSPSPRTNRFHQVLLVLRTQFAEHTWQAFWRSVIDDRASTEVSQELHMTANAVRKAKGRVLKRLRQQLVDVAYLTGSGEASGQ